ATRTSARSRKKTGSVVTRAWPPPRWARSVPPGRQGARRINGAPGPGKSRTRLGGNVAGPGSVHRVGRSRTKTFRVGSALCESGKWRWRRTSSPCFGDGLLAGHPRGRSSLVSRLRARRRSVSSNPRRPFVRDAHARLVRRLTSIGPLGTVLRRYDVSV